MSFSIAVIGSETGLVLDQCGQPRRCRRTHGLGRLWIGFATARCASRAIGRAIANRGRGADVKTGHTTTPGGLGPCFRPSPLTVPAAAAGI